MNLQFFRTRIAPSGDWRQPTTLLFLLSIGMAVSMSTFSALINNFAIERATFTGIEIGFLHTVREIPGFLAFTVVFWLVVIREQRLAYVALLFMGIGTAFMGMFPSVAGIYVTAVIASIGFHYFESLRTSLAWQWLEKGEAPAVLGKIMGINALASLTMFLVILGALAAFDLDMKYIYLLGGGVTVATVIIAWRCFPMFRGAVVQRKNIVLRRRYGLYYALTFFAGARRQISMVFVGFLLVEKFGFTVSTMTSLLLVHYALNVFLAPKIGQWIGRFGERRALMAEYAGLIGIFAAYAFVDVAWAAVILYLINQMLFAVHIAMRTYFQKIADPADMANTAGVSSTINHIAAVFLPAVLGFVWVADPSSVFLIGCGIGTASLICASLIPRDPAPGNEILFFKRPQPAGAAE